ncbi:hypothetical protein [Mycobacterium vicinigordonae]|uniref:Uncharacterized protein n=1 Tax=Mycobacterium vicinigordonae TaxID=1719132 RepID=A0A7D6EBB4_9MYCO|nr:hypothetical protein [Mycobacterium vicinigordonae]QLL09005.1 hypothetical protein H0P51_08995 [Mycobacterium vicinigordonae]
MSIFVFADTLFNVSPAEQQLLVRVINSAVNCDPNLEWENEHHMGSDYKKAVYASSNLTNQVLFAESRAMINALINSPRRIEVRGCGPDWQGFGMGSPISSFGGLYVAVDGSTYDIRVDTSDWGGTGYVHPNLSLTATVYSFVDTRVYNALTMAFLGQTNYLDVNATFPRIHYENRYRANVGVERRGFVAAYATQGMPDDGGTDWPACTKPLFKEHKVADSEYSPPKWQ